MDRTLSLALPPTRSTLALREGELLVLRKARDGVVLVLDGEVWITQEGDPCDHVLGPGGCLRIAVAGAVIVHACCDSDVTLLPRAAPRPVSGRRHALGRWLRRWSRLRPA